TLGIEVNEGRPGASMPGRMLPVIERNTVVPVSRMRSVVPGRDFQREVEVRIFQGEARLVRDNIPLGSFELALSPRRIADQSIEVRFTYDINGILEVSARAEADGASERIVIRHGPDTPTAEDAEARMAALAALKIHPREQATNRLLLAKGDRVFEEQLGVDRDRLGSVLGRFEAALTAQSPEEIEQVGAELARLLHEMEGPR
ncbi:MAG: Hsp70 family protein, partial [Sphingomonas sp.]